MNRLTMLLVLVSVIVAAPAMAKDGAYIGVYYPSTEIAGEAGQNVDSGTGWGARVGVGFGRYVAVEGNYTSTTHDVTGGGSMDMKGVAVDLKLHFPLTSLDRGNVMTLEPYVLIGYGLYEASNGGN